MKRKLAFIVSLVVILALSCILASAEEAETQETGIEEEDLVGVFRPDQPALSIGNLPGAICRGQGHQLTVTNLFPNNTVTWSSNNSCVVVTQDGYIRGVSQGYATITASIPMAPSGYSTVATCTVYVLNDQIIENGMYAFHSECSDVTDWFAYEYNRNPGNVPTVSLASLLGKTEYLWILELGNDGFYTIRSRNSFKVLYCENNAITPGTLISRASNGNASGTKWSVILNADGTYSFVPSASTNNNVQLGVIEDEEETYMLLRTPSSLTPGNTKWGLFRKLPTTGDELEYGEHSWLSDTSSYQYALNYYYSILEEPDAQWNVFQIIEGDTAGLYSVPYGATDPDVIISAVIADFEELDNRLNRTFSFSEIGQYEECEEGQYKIALAVGEYGHQWYRQDADGFWSYFDEQLETTRDVDDNLNAIIDPQYAIFYDYPIFVGYYAITPWN